MRPFDFISMQNPRQRRPAGPSSIAARRTPGSRGRTPRRPTEAHRLTLTIARPPGNRRNGLSPARRPALGRSSPRSFAPSSVVRAPPPREISGAIPPGPDASKPNHGDPARRSARICNKSDQFSCIVAPTTASREPSPPVRWRRGPRPDRGRRSFVQRRGLDCLSYGRLRWFEENLGRRSPPHRGAPPRASRRPRGDIRATAHKSAFGQFDGKGYFRGDDDDGRSRPSRRSRGRAPNCA